MTEAESVLPQVVLENVRRPHGIVLLTGLRASGLEATLDAVEKAAAPRRAHRWTDDRAIPKETEVVLFDGDMDPERLRRLLLWSEEGRLVVIAQRSPSPLSALRRIFSLTLGEGRRHVTARLADQLSLLSGQMRLKSLQDGFEDAREVVLVTPLVRKAIEDENLAALDELLRSEDEASGTVSFNQSLLQLLLRRRIDIKTAFESTRDPVHLDQILKKVGI